LAAEYVRDHHKKPEYWNPHPKLREVTTKDIADRLKAQVFQQVGYTGSISEPEAYLVKDGKVYPMSIASGGYGLTMMCVCNLDKAKAPELVYSYSWGSGIHRSHLDAMTFEGARPVKISAPFVIRDCDLRFVKSDDSTVKVYATMLHIWPADGSKDVLLGRLTLVNHDKARALGIAFDPHLDPRWRKLVWSASPRRQTRTRRPGRSLVSCVLFR
jgi:hypothetical protein